MTAAVATAKKDGRPIKNTTAKAPKVTKGPTKVAKGVKTTAKPAKPAKPKKTTKKKRGGLPSRAKGDFTNDQKITIVGKIANGRGKCFKTGMTVGDCLAAQKKAGLKNRRGFIRRTWKAGAIQIEGAKTP